MNSNGNGSGRRGGRIWKTGSDQYMLFEAVIASLAALLIEEVSVVGCTTDWVFELMVDSVVAELLDVTKTLASVFVEVGAGDTGVDIIVEENDTEKLLLELVEVAVRGSPGFA